jgi:hypothetical protein
VLSQIQRRKKYRFHEENGVSFLGEIPNVRFLKETPSNDLICAKCYKENFLLYQVWIPIDTNQIFYLSFAFDFLSIFNILSWA